RSGPRRPGLVAAARHDRRRSPAPGAGQRHRQCHPGRERPRRRPGPSHPGPDLASGRPAVPHPHHGQGGRHRARRPAPHLRSVLYDAPDGNRHRSCDLAKHHRGTGGPDQRGQRARSRHGPAHRAPPRFASRMTKTTGTILLVDDEAKIRNALAQALREDGHEVMAVGNPREAQRLLARGSFDVLLLDNLMPELTGLDLIRELVSTTLAEERPQILLMTAHATVESAIEAMKLGALDYLQKPFEIDELLVVVNRALDHQRLRTQHGYLLKERDEEFNQYGIVGRSKRVQDVIR